MQRAHPLAGLPGARLLRAGRALLAQRRAAARALAGASAALAAMVPPPSPTPSPVQFGRACLPRLVQIGRASLTCGAG
jgi:hypothetical protein